MLFGDDVHVDHHEHHAQQAGHIARCKHTSTEIWVANENTIRPMPGGMMGVISEEAMVMAALNSSS